VRQPSEIELSYLAGYFDGEGCIHISKTGARVVGIKSCYPKVVKTFHKFYGGKFTKDKNNKKNIYWRNFFYFRIFGENSVNVIRSLYPFLREKKEQARLFIKHASSKDAHTKTQYAVQIKSLKKVKY
jgi:intein/homing endonuclease